MDTLINISKTDFGLEGEVYFGLFEQYIEFVADDIFDEEYVKKHAHYLNSLSENVIDALCEASIRYCNDFLNMIGKEEKTFEIVRDVLSLIYPSVLMVPYPEKNDPVVHMELNCEWEVEHGMEWLVRNSKVLYVGAFNGIDPWGDYTAKDRWNYA